MNQIAVEDFTKYLASKNLLPAKVAECVSSKAGNPERSLRKLWEASDLSAHAFADEVAQFYG